MGEFKSLDDSEGVTFVLLYIVNLCIWVAWLGFGAAGAALAIDSAIRGDYVTAMGGSLVAWFAFLVSSFIIAYEK